VKEGTMLVLSRKVGEAVVIGKDVTITVINVRGGVVRLSFSAPPDTKILRLEVAERDEKEARK
jgi:carbon storage regulator